MKEEKQKEAINNNTEDSYKLSSVALRQGYSSTIDGRKFVIDYAKDWQGKRASAYASLCSEQDTPEGRKWIPIMPPVYELTNLTNEQLWQLAHAQIIKMSKKQEKAFRDKFRVLKAKKEED